MKVPQPTQKDLKEVKSILMRAWHGKVRKRNRECKTEEDARKYYIKGALVKLTSMID